MEIAKRKKLNSLIKAIGDEEDPLYIDIPEMKEIELKEEEERKIKRKKEEEEKKKTLVLTHTVHKCNRHQNAAVCKYYYCTGDNPLDNPSDNPPNNPPGNYTKHHDDIYGESYGELYGRHGRDEYNFYM